MANSKDVPFEEKLAAVKNAISVFTKLHEAKEFKEEGSKFFKDGHYVKAIFTYRKIFDILDFESIKPYVLADDKQAEWLPVDWTFLSVGWNWNNGSEWNESVFNLD